MKNIITTNFILGVRSYVYPIYLLLGLAYGLMLLAFPETYLPTMVPIFLIFEPGLAGFMFVGTEIFAEKKDGAINALAVTPIDWNKYILTKTLLLSIISTIGSIFIIGIGTRSLNGLFPVVVGTFLVSMVYTLLGIALSAKYRDLDDYFIPILAVLIVSLLPFAHYHGYLTSEVWKILYIVPSYPAIYFFKAPFEEIALKTLIYSAIALLVWFGIAYYLAKNRFYKYAVEGLR